MKNFLVNKWRLGAFVLVFLCLLSLGGWSLYHIILNDQFNTEAKAGNLPAMQNLRAHGAAIEGRSIHFQTPLMSAAEGGQTNTVLYLLAQGADVNAHNASGSVLMWAVASGNRRIVGLLLAHGVNVNWRSDLGDTALKTAREYKQPGIAKMLRLSGAVN